MELEKWEEDFGQTLGHWGVGDGPYLVLPFLGPSNLRDTTGLVVDSLTFSAIDPLNFDSNDDLEIPFTC
jgi:phospholipid-binding lipoprotein MlaA